MPKIGSSKTFSSESLKGDTQLVTIRFPNELGEEHPFDFGVNEKLYKSHGLIQAIVDKYIDQIIGAGFYVKSEDPRAEEIVNQWLKDVNWDTVFRKWAKEALSKGTGFLELAGKVNEVPNEIKILDAKRMYIIMDEKGRVTGYNQIKAKNLGSIQKVSANSYIHFEPHEIAYIPINIIGDCPYGYGILEPIKSILKSLVDTQIYMDEIMRKKAESKYHVALGDKDNLPTQVDIDNYREKLEYQENKQEWVTDGLTNIKILDFGSLGDKFTFPVEHNLRTLLYSVQIPEVIMGRGSIPEGLAKVQLDTFERRIKSFQAEFEKVIEQQIFKRILTANGILTHVEFEWGQPSNDDKIKRIAALMPLLSNMMLSPSLRKEIEKDIARQLDFNEELLETIEEEKERELEQPQPLVPGQNRTEGWVTGNDGRKYFIRDKEYKEVPKSVYDDYKNRGGSPPPNVRLVYAAGIPVEEPMAEVVEVINEDAPKGGQMKTTSSGFHYNRKEWGLVFNEEDFDGNLEETAKSFKGLKIEKRKSDGYVDVFASGIKDTEPEKATRLFDTFAYKYKSIKNKKKEFTKHFTQEELKENYELKEWLNFNYKEYVRSILNFINKDDFKDLKAMNQIELDAGYLNSKQIHRLKSVLKNGFINEDNILEINKDINEIVKPKDLLVIENNKIKLNEQGNPLVALPKESRTMMITRTEVTRTAVNGSLDYYDEKNIEDVQFVASLGQRTCEICNGLNGKLYGLQESYDVIPVHSNCRCTFIPVIK